MFMDTNIASAAPKVIALGTRDNSQRVVPVVHENHGFIPLFFFYASKGSTKRRYVKGNPGAIYGDDTFLPTSKYFTHQTLGLNMCVGNGNLVGMQRIVPVDAREAVLMLWFVREQKQIPVYQLDVNGKRVLDATTNAPIVVDTIDGHTYRWEVEETANRRYEELLELGRSGTITTNSTPPPAPVSGDVVMPSDSVVFDSVVYSNDTTTAITIHGTLDATALENSGLTDEGAIPSTPASGDTLPSDINTLYLVDQHLVFNNTGTDITVGSTVDLPALLDLGMTDKGYVPVALEGTVVPPLGSVIFGTNLYTNNSNINVTINELTLTATDLTSAGLTDAGAWVSSIVTKTPWFVMAYNGEGEGGNNNGVRIYPTSTNEDYNITDFNRFAFAAELVERPDKHANVVNIQTVTGENSINFVHEGQAYDMYNRPLSLENLVEAYDGTAANLGLQEPPFRAIHVFQDAIDAELQVLAAFEKDATTDMPWSDFQRGSALTMSGVELAYLANPITSMHSNGSPYISLVADSSPTAMQLGRYNTVFANGGYDGTLSLRDFEMQVADEITRYGDINDPVQDTARDIVTDFWDTGFNLDAKLRFNQFTAIRKDLNLVIALFENDEYLSASGPSSSTYLKGDPQTRVDEIAIATLLLNNIRLVPESVKFNTGAMRTQLIAGSGRVENTLFRDRVPLTFEYLDKTSKYCGGDRWAGEHRFDTAPGHIVTGMFDLSDSWASEPIVQKFWDLGVNIHQSYDETRSMLPVDRSCYEGDTSVLTSAKNTRVCADVFRVVNRIHRDLVGSTRITGARLARLINEEISRDTNAKYDGYATIEPNAQQTELDRLRGFSTSIPVDVKFGNMQTVFTVAVTALRREDYAESL